jgi:regulator of replication initiation timing
MYSVSFSQSLSFFFQITKLTLENELMETNLHSLRSLETHLKTELEELRQAQSLAKTSSDDEIDTKSILTSTIDSTPTVASKFSSGVRYDAGSLNLKKPSRLSEQKNSSITPQSVSTVSQSSQSSLYAHLIEVNKEQENLKQQLAEITGTNASLAKENRSLKDEIESLNQQYHACLEELGASRLVQNDELTNNEKVRQMEAERLQLKELSQKGLYDEEQTEQNKGFVCKKSHLEEHQIACDNEFFSTIWRSLRRLLTEIHSIFSILSAVIHSQPIFAKDRLQHLLTPEDELRSPPDIQHSISNLLMNILLSIREWRLSSINEYMKSLADP